MLKADQLREFRPTCEYKGGQEVTLERIQSEINALARQYEIPVAFEKDQIKSGGFFNSSIVDCIIMYHPEHEKDYYKFAISVSYYNKKTIVNVNDFGESKNLKKLSMRENAKQNAKNGAKFGILKAEDGSDMMGAILTMGKGAVGGLLSIGGSKKKQEEEEIYYNAIIQILDEIIG